MTWPYAGCNVSSGLITSCKRPVATCTKRSRFDTLVAEQDLNHPDVDLLLQQMSSETVAQSETPVAKNSQAMPKLNYRASGLVLRSIADAHAVVFACSSTRTKLHTCTRAMLLKHNRDGVRSGRNTHVGLNVLDTTRN